MKVIYGQEVFDMLSEFVDPRHAAVLVVDMQNDYCARSGHLDKEGTEMTPTIEMVPRLKTLLDRGREAGVRIIFTQNTTLPDMVSESPALLRYKDRRGYLHTETGLEQCLDGTWGHKIMDEMGRREHEIIVKKYRPTAFLGTSLDQILRAKGIKSVIVTGVVSEGCIQATAMDALWRDFYTVVVKDCIATADAERHASALTIMSERLEVHDSDEIINEWAKVKRHAKFHGYNGRD